MSRFLVSSNDAVRKQLRVSPVQTYTSPDSRHSRNSKAKEQRSPGQRPDHNVGEGRARNLTSYYTHAYVHVWGGNKTGSKFVSVLSRWGCLVVSQTLLEIIKFRFFSAIFRFYFYFWIIEQFSTNSDLYSTRCFLFTLKCTKIFGGWSPFPDFAGGGCTALLQDP